MYQLKNIVNIFYCILKVILKFKYLFICTQGNGEGHLVSQILQTQLDFNIKKADFSDKTEKIVC